MVTRSLSTDRNPPSTLATTSEPSPAMRTSPSTITPSSGEWPGRMPISPSAVRALTRAAFPPQTLRSAATSSTVSATEVLPRRRRQVAPGGTSRECGATTWRCPQAYPLGAVPRLSGPSRTGGRATAGLGARPRTRRPARPVGAGRPPPRGRGPSEGLLDVRPVALDVLQATAHEEGLLGDKVVLAVRDLRERLHGLVQRHRRPLDAGELLGHVGVLRQEPLDATGPVDEDLVLLGELVDAEDRDDVLELLVALQDLLDPHRGVVVLLRDVPRVEDPGRRGQRVHGRVDAQRGDVTRELGGGVEVRERRGRRGVGVVVGRHVDGLHRGDRVATGRGDALLQHAHLV